MLAAPRGLAAPSITFGNDPRSARLAQEHSKLAQSLFNYVSTNPASISLGPDPLVKQLLSAKGFSKFDIVCLRVVALGLPFTALAVPTRIGRDPDWRAALLEAKTEAGILGTKCLLVPQRSIRGNVRAQVARTLAMSHYVQFRREHAEAIRLHVRVERLASLAECASLIDDHDDPIGIVLALCACGDLLIDRTQPIGPSSWVAMAA
jgi:hypothetical protein